MKTLCTIIALCLSLGLISGANASTDKPRRAKVNSISYSGNHTYDDTRLDGLMLTRPSRFLAPSKYHPDVFLDDLETLVSFYHQNGFLQAHITDTSITIDSIENKVDITIMIEEGNRTFIEGVALFGNSFFGDSALMEHIGFEKGEPLRRPVIEDAVVSMLALYSDHGFIDATVTPSVNVNDSAHLALLDFFISEGPNCRIDSVHIPEWIRTRRNVILRELDFAQGDTVKYSSLITSQRRLYLTGLFQSVFVRPIQSVNQIDTARTILVELKEKPSSELSFSVGYGTVEKARGRVELNTINLAGTARKAGLGTEANFIRQGISLSFSEPWTLGTRWKTDLSIFGQLRQEPSYHAEVIGSKLTLGCSIGTYTNLGLSYRFENTNLTEVEVSSAVEELDPRIRSLTLNLSYDSRDNMFNPTSGRYASWSNEIAGSFLQGSNTFARSFVILKTFHSVSRATVIASAVEVGWMQAFGEDEEVPLNERFFAGGPTSLRGFGYQMVGPIDDTGEPLGGRLKLVWNVVEIRRSIYKMIGAVLFFEIGNVWPKLEALRIHDLRADFGGGIRVNSPLGVARLDCGINVDKRYNEPGARVFFSMGQAF